MATKIKRVKTGDVNPPTEIRENTKARRAWLAAEVARLNAQPNTEAKIVGTGSYQRISVYAVTEVEGRLRQRGVCQCCGNAQVVDSATGGLVLHGYERPGTGSIYGTCPGVGHRPLNVEKALTEVWHADAVEKHTAAEAALAAAAQEEQAALTAMYSGEGTDRGPVERDAYAEKPGEPRTYRMSDEDKHAAVLAYRERFKAWARKFPLHGRYERAQAAHGAARQAEWQKRQEREHFAQLLASGVYGSPLVDEVVP